MGEGAAREGEGKWESEVSRLQATLREYLGFTLGDEEKEKGQEGRGVVRLSCGAEGGREGWRGGTRTAVSPAPPLHFRSRADDPQVITVCPRSVVA